jgi:hypothetical protein
VPGGGRAYRRKACYREHKRTPEEGSKTAKEDEKPSRSQHQGWLVKDIEQKEKEEKKEQRRRERKRMNEK